MKDIDRPRVTSEELRRVGEIAGKGGLYAQGLYTLVVEDGLSLEEAHQQAVSEKRNEEHIPAWNRARDVLQEHAQQLGIMVVRPVEKL